MVNRVILQGNLTRDPELRTIPSGASVCRFGIANNETWKDSEGNRQTRATFVECEAWGRIGETIAEWFSKGGQIIIEGTLKTSQWETLKGEKRSALSVVVEFISFSGDSKKAGTADATRSVQTSKTGNPTSKASQS